MRSFAVQERPKPSLQGHSRKARQPADSGLATSHGVPLPSETRSCFEPQFGYDFSRVRVHAGSEAADLAQGMRANAYTVGHDIVFGAGQYAPAGAKGKRLLAHELAHVVQQAAPHGATRGGISENALERQAGQFAEAATAGKVTVPLASLAHSAPVAPARQPKAGSGAAATAEPAGEGVLKTEDIDLHTAYWEEELQKSQQSKGEYKPKSLAEQGWEIVIEKGEAVFKDDPRENHKRVGTGAYQFSVRIRNRALKKEAWFAFYGDTGLAPEPEEKGRTLGQKIWHFGHDVLDYASLICKPCLLGSAAMSAAEGDLPGTIIRIGLHRIGGGTPEEAEAAALREEEQRVAAQELAAQQRFATKVGLNASSATSRQLLQNLDMTAESFIGKFRAGNLKSVFPSDFLKKTIREGLLSGDSTVRKLLTDGRFIK